jgi:hypothetical protein
MLRLFATSLLLSAASCATTSSSSEAPPTTAAPTADSAPAAAPAPAATPASPATSPASTGSPDLTARGRELATLFWGGDGKAWYAQMSPSVQGHLTADQVQTANQALIAKLGGEKSLVSEQMTTFHGAPTYQRAFICNALPDPLDLNLVFDPKGMLLAYTLRPHGSSIIPGQ